MSRKMETCIYQNLRFSDFKLSKVAKFHNFLQKLQNYKI